MPNVYDANTYAGIFQKVVLDSTGAYRLDPDSMPHAYTYDSNGNILTDTVTDGTNSWKKTYTVVNNLITAETAWVKQ